MQVAATRTAAQPAILTGAILLVEGLSMSGKGLALPKALLARLAVTPGWQMANITLTAGLSKVTMPVQARGCTLAA